MKKLIFDNFFKSYSIGKLPIRYITQNKEIDSIRESCIRKTLKCLNDRIMEIDRGIYFAITHETVIKTLDKTSNIKIRKLRLPGKFNVNHLKKYIIGSNTACATCKNEKCTAKTMFEKESDMKHVHIMIMSK